MVQLGLCPNQYDNIADSEDQIVAWGQ